MKITEKQRVILKKSFQAIGAGAVEGQRLMKADAPAGVVRQHVDDLALLINEVKAAIEIAEGANAVLGQVEEAKDRALHQKLRLRPVVMRLGPRLSKA